MNCVVSQVLYSVGVRYFLKGIFPRVTSQVAIFQVVTSQMCNFSSGNFPKVRLGPLRRSRLQQGPSAAARTDLGSCRLGNCTVGKLPLWKMPLGSCQLGKILGKVPNIYSVFSCMQLWLWLKIHGHLGIQNQKTLYPNKKKHFPIKRKAS